MNLISKWKSCFCFAAIMILSGIFSNNFSAQKLPGLTLEQSQKYGKEIQRLIDKHNCSPYNHPKIEKLIKEYKHSIEEANRCQ